MTAAARHTAALAQLVQIAADLQRTSAALVSVCEVLASQQDPAKAAYTQDHGGDDDFSEGNLIDTWTAAERFGYPADTVRKWCRQGCGKKIGGRWMASIVRIRRRINGG